MKIIYLFIVLLFLLTGCAYVGYSIDNARPNEYGLDGNLTGRIFTISCNGNGYARLKTVKKRCLNYISQFAYKNGYNFFTVIDQNATANTSTASYTTTTPVTTYSTNFTSTTYVPQTHYYNITRYEREYLFVLINETEKSAWKNYFKVVDYYKPEKQNPSHEINPIKKLTNLTLF